MDKEERKKEMRRAVNRRCYLKRIGGDIKYYTKNAPSNVINIEFINLLKDKKNDIQKIAVLNEDTGEYETQSEYSPSISSSEYETDTASYETDTDEEEEIEVSEQKPILNKLSQTYITEQNRIFDEYQRELLLKKRSTSFY